jgi:hypothetical protein
MFKKFYGRNLQMFKIRKCLSTTQYSKTFSICNLRMFVISYIIDPWQFLNQIFVSKAEAYPSEKHLEAPSYQVYELTKTSAIYLFYVWDLT